MDQERRIELYAAAAADHVGYIAEVLRARDRAIGVRDTLESAGHPRQTGCEYDSCPAVGSVLLVTDALGTNEVIDHAALHAVLDMAEAHLT